MSEEQLERAYPPLCIRHGTMDDLSFLEDTWAKGLAKDRGGPLGERWIRIDGGKLLVAPNEFHEAARARIRSLLERSGILVGHRSDAPDVVWAWLAFEVLEGADAQLLFHWAWTRPELRRRGYASTLLAQAHQLAGLRYFRCSHLTRAGEALIAKVY